MLLYIPIRITLLWNVRKCVVLASASSLVPWSHPENRFGPHSHQGSAPAGISLADKERVSESYLGCHLTGSSLPRTVPSLGLRVQAHLAVVPASQTSLLLLAWPGEATSPKGFSQNRPLPPLLKLLPPVILLLKRHVSVNQTEL